MKNIFFFKIGAKNGFYTEVDKITELYDRIEQSAEIFIDLLDGVGIHAGVKSVRVGFGRSGRKKCT